MSGEAHHFEDLCSFKPENGAILANATPIGMHPNTDRIPVAEVAHTYIYISYFENILLVSSDFCKLKPVFHHVTGDLKGI